MNPAKIGDAGSCMPEDRAEWPPLRDWGPAEIRKLMSWIFLVTSLQYSTVSLRSFPYAIHRHYGDPLLRILLTAPVFSIVMGSISALAWWTVWKEKSSAKVWALAASLMYVLVFLRQFIIPIPPAWDHYAGALFTGAVGLVVFVRRADEAAA